MTTLLTETRERFLLAITAKVPVERIAEIHFFQPIKQGGVESGVAVAAAWPEQIPVPTPEQNVSEVVAEGVQEDLQEGVEQIAEVVAEQLPEPVGEPPKHDHGRHVVYMAHYRHTLKGIDRGKWETNVVAEADAPLVTVDAVVRGVQRRSGDVDDATRMEGDDVRQFINARRPTGQTKL